MIVCGIFITTCAQERCMIVCGFFITVGQGLSPVSTVASVLHKNTTY